MSQKFPYTPVTIDLEIREENIKSQSFQTVSEHSTRENHQMKKKKTTTMADPFLKAFSPPELKIAAEFLTNWLPFLTKTLCQNCTQTLSNTISSLDPDFSGEGDAELLPSASKEIHCDCNGDSDSDSLGSWKDSVLGRSKYVPEALPVSWVFEEAAMGRSNYVPETLVTDSSVVGCSDRVRNTDVFGSLNSDYAPETVNVGSPGSIGSWKSDYRPETRNVGSRDSSGSRNRIDSGVECLDRVADTVVFGSWKSDYVPETCNVGSPGSIGSWKSDYVDETRNVGSRDSSGSRNRIDSAVECLDHVADTCLDHVADTVVFGSWKSDLVAETHNLGSPGSIGSWKSDYRPETGNVGSRGPSGSRNRIDSAVECLDHVADTVVFGSWKSDYVAETRNVGSLDLYGCRNRTDSVVECSDHVADTVIYGSCFSWKSDYVPENKDRNVGSTDSIGSWISNYVPGPRVAGSPDSSLGSWKSDYVAEDLNDGSPNLPGSWELNYVPDAVNVASSDSHGSWKGSASECLDDVVPEVLGSDPPNSLGSSNKDSSIGCSDNVLPEGTFVNSPSFPASWADMVYDELEHYDDLRENKENEKIVFGSPTGSVQKKSATLTKVQREYLRFKMVKRKKDFTCLRRVNGNRMNILEGLELHTGVFSVAEQKRIVDFIYMLEEQGRKGELQERTFSAPEKWMQGKGRVTIQFGCCYNYAVLKDGSPPGILRNKQVDPMPQLFRVMIQRLVAWHVLPPTCVPDSCIVNIYDEGDCIPPHIDHHDFLRPFCTVSFLSECNIVFGSTLRIVGPGEFSGDVAIPLPLGSVLILNGNGADVAKHCVPKVPTKRISITFRKMDESKRPDGFVPDPDLQCLEPLPFEKDLLRTPPRTQSSDFPSLQKDRQSLGVAPKSVGTSNFLTPQKDRYSFGVSPKSMDSSNFVQPQKDRESSNPVPKSMETSDFPPHRRNRQSFRFDPNNLESEFPSLQNGTQSFRASPKSVGSSDSTVLQKDRDTFRGVASTSVNSSNFPPFQRNRQSIRIVVDSETGKRFSSNVGSRPEPRHSILGSSTSSSETRYSDKKAWYSGIGTPFAGTPQARYSNTNDRYTGSDPRYTGSDPRYSSRSRPKALGGPPLRVRLGT